MRGRGVVVREDVCQVRCFKADVVAKLREEQPGEEDIQGAQRFLAALADGARLRILRALRDGQELCVCDVTHVLGIRFATASHHLRKLRDLDILACRIEGKMAYYSLRDPAAAELAERALAIVGNAQPGRARRPAALR